MQKKYAVSGGGVELTDQVVLPGSLGTVPYSHCPEAREFMFQGYLLGSPQS